jgi:hypothetical protein
MLFLRFRFSHHIVGFGPIVGAAAEPPMPVSTTRRAGRYA